MSESVGFIGLGSMGLLMIRVLAAAGYTMRVYDVDPAACHRASEIAGVEVLDSIPAVSGKVPKLFTCVPNDSVLETLYLGDGGVASAIQSGAISVDCSTVSPSVTRTINARLGELGAQHLDASMLGSVPQAETGQIGFCGRW